MRSGDGSLIVYTARAESPDRGDVDSISAGEGGSFVLGPFDSIAISRGQVV